MNHLPRYLIYSASSHPFLVEALRYLVRHTLLYTLRSSGARPSELSEIYRHVAPLERKIEHLNFTGKSMDFNAYQLELSFDWRTPIDK